MISVLFLLNLSFSVDANIETRDYVPRNVNIDRSNVPKNILFGSFFGGRSHNKPMLDIGAILIERGHNVSIFFFNKKNFFFLVVFFSFIVYCTFLIYR